MLKIKRKRLTRMNKIKLRAILVYSTDSKIKIQMKKFIDVFKQAKLAKTNLYVVHHNNFGYNDFTMYSFCKLDLRYLPSRELIISFNGLK